MHLKLSPLTQAPRLVGEDPLEMLWQYASGRFPSFLDDEHTPVVWKCYSHRGIQRLDEIRIPKGQRRYVFSDKFEVRFDTAFEQVLRHCADPGRDTVRWLTPPLVKAYLALYELGFAHSFEAWQDGRLVAGGFGVQVGGIINAESMFHLVSNACKAAWGQFLFRCRDRGYSLVDVIGVADHHVKYGEEHVPQWQFEEMLRSHLGERPSLTDERPTPPLPLQIRASLPVARGWRALKRRVLQQVNLHNPAPTDGEMEMSQR